MNNPTLMLEDFVLPHAAFAVALQRIQSSFEFALLKSEAEGLAIIGESGTGKTSVLRTFYDEHPPSRESDGMKIPVLFVTVPSSPTVKSFAGVILEALGAPDPEKGTENEKTSRIRVLLRNVGTRIIIIDEFQHFYDRGTHRTFHIVADWLKILIVQTNATVVIAGLPTAIGVIESNEQLMRRFSSPIRLNRFDWNNREDRDEFKEILKSYHEVLAERYELPFFASDDMAFRFWLATNGLMGYVSKLLRHLDRQALHQGKSQLTIADLHSAHMAAIWSSQRIPDLPKPFAGDMDLTYSASVAETVQRIGTLIPVPQTPKRQARRVRGISLNQLLVSS